MTRSNIHDRLTIKSIYPRDAFEVDSRRNAEIRTGILHGLKITSPPDANGNFGLCQASRHIGENSHVRNCTQIKSLKNQYFRFAEADGPRPRY